MMMLLILAETSLSIKTCCLAVRFTKLYFWTLACLTDVISLVTIKSFASRAKLMMVKARIAIFIKMCMENRKEITINSYSIPFIKYFN